MALIFEKVLEENLPSAVTPGVDIIYFTETGKIYASSNDGTLLKLGGEDLSPYFIKALAGDLETLTTEDKSNLVAAINEVNAKQSGPTGDYYTKTEIDNKFTEVWNELNGVNALVDATLNLL